MLINSKMLNESDDFMVLESSNVFLPRKNLFITVFLCILFYLIIMYDVYILDKFTLLKVVQVVLMTINSISLCVLLKKDPGQVLPETQTKNKIINFTGNNVLFVRKYPVERHVIFTESTFDDELCEKCLVMKNDNITHCQFCNICLRNRDHHCAWFNKCIADENITVFLLFILSLTFSACFVVCDTFKIFTSRIPRNFCVLKIIIVVLIMFASMLLFVLSLILSIQYTLAFILGVSTKKLLNCDWKCKSSRICYSIRRNRKIEIVDLDD